MLLTSCVPLKSSLFISKWSIKNNFEINKKIRWDLVIKAFLAPESIILSEPRKDYINIYYFEIKNNDATVFKSNYKIFRNFITMEVFTQTLRLINLHEDFYIKFEKYIQSFINEEVFLNINENSSAKERKLFALIFDNFDKEQNGYGLLEIFNKFGTPRARLAKLS
jgi:hypothetical protein